MSVSTRETAVRDRLRRLIASLDTEDLEERLAPVKCEKHPDSDECTSVDYGAPEYAVPAYGEPDYGVPGGGGS
jgi:hypothetical protein